MKTSINKTKIATIFIFVLLMASVTLMANMPVQAQYTNMQEGGSIPLPSGVTPDFAVATNAFLSFRPNPVGVGQSILVNMWVEPPIHVSRYLKGYKVTITNPDGAQDVKVLDSYRGDSTAWFEYVVDKVGTWKLKLDFLGAYFPAGNYTAPVGGATVSGVIVNFTQSCYYKPSSTAEQELVVQSDMIASWPPSALPSDYWTRPVAFANREWAPILGNYPWYGPGGGNNWPADTNIYWSSQYNFIPYVQAPNAAHIVWKRQNAISGIIGGDIPGFQMSTASGTPTIIYAGRCYQTLTQVKQTLINGTYYEQPVSVWRCYDLRSGEVYWEQTGITQVPTVIEYDTGVGEVPGAAGRAFGEIGYASLVYIGNSRLIKYNPFTGAVALNVSIAPLTTGTYYMNKYVLSVQDLGANATPNRYRLINWTTAGQAAGFGAVARNYAIISNTTYARSSLPTLIDFNVGLGATYTGITPTAMGASYGTIMQGYDLVTGTMLWNNTYADEGMYSGSCAVADHGKVAVLMKNGYWLAWDLRTGRLAWKSEVMDYPWGKASFGAYAVQSAYGLFYRQSYDGVYAFNWTNGKIAWHYKAPANPFETPYRDENDQTGYSFDGAAFIADGKMYVLNNEHTPTPPITRGWGVHCINATTGEGIWKISGIWVWSGPGPIADGYLTISSSDGIMYVFGKGKSATTVTASPEVSIHGSNVLIKGTVLDLSPAQPGTPCVSKNSMSTWMEYLHLQQPIAGLWNNETITGVPVSLDTLDPNGNYVHVGDVTTDGYSGTFGFTWEPEVPGQYTVTATFRGDDSYGSSFATTYVSVSEALPATATPEPPQAPPDYTLLLYALLAVGIIAIILMLIVLFRKR
ncbi:MAG TPA: PQQ-binding-like beta-propeller repeat protein [Candidatus Bathyarchaeia archaeon]